MLEYYIVNHRFSLDRRRANAGLSDSGGHLVSGDHAAYREAGHREYYFKGARLTLLAAIVSVLISMGEELQCEKRDKYHP
jgi:hypothetical protein